MGRDLHRRGNPADGHGPQHGAPSVSPEPGDPLPAGPPPEIEIMLYTIVVVLLALWLLGLVTSFTAGGLLHILLVVAVVVLVYQLVTGRRGV